MHVIKLITSLVKLGIVLAVGVLMFSCVAAIVKAPSLTSGVSCSTLQTKDGTGYRTTTSCN